MNLDEEINLVIIKPREQLPAIFNSCRKFDFDSMEHHPADISNILQLMCFETKAMGLAAPQLNYDYNVFYIRGFGDTACFNPKIVDSSEDEDIAEETTASIPGLIVKIKRPTHIRVRWTNVNGETDTHVYTGLTSRVFQRKMDYLNGIKLLDRANFMHRDNAIKNYYKSTSGLILK